MKDFIITKHVQKRIQKAFLFQDQAQIFEDYLKNNNMSEIEKTRLQNSIISRRKESEKILSFYRKKIQNSQYA
jgi:hypothetical protein